MDINPRHFALLRLAQLRQLQIRRLSRGVFAVASHSRPGHWYKVTAGVCECPALTFCTHAALAFDTSIRLEAEPPEYVAYMNEQREDFAALRLRVLLDEQTAEDKAFTRPLIEKAQASFVMPERVGCGF